MNKCDYTRYIVINDIKKTTIDNSVRYIPIDKKTKEKEIKPKTIKAGSLPKKQNKNLSQNSKKFNKNVVASAFGYLK